MHIYPTILSSGIFSYFCLSEELLVWTLRIVLCSTFKWRGACLVVTVFSSPRAAFLPRFLSTFLWSSLPPSPFIIFSATLCSLLFPLFHSPEIMTLRDRIHNAFIKLIFILPTLLWPSQGVCFFDFEITFLTWNSPGLRCPETVHVKRYPFFKYISYNPEFSLSGCVPFFSMVVIFVVMFVFLLIIIIIIQIWKRGMRRRLMKSQDSVNIGGWEDSLSGSTAWPWPSSRLLPHTQPSWLTPCTRRARRVIQGANKLIS